MSIPDYLLPHTVIWVIPALFRDAYGNQSQPDYGASAQRTEIRAWIEQYQRTEDEIRRDAQIQDWKLFTNQQGLSGRDRIEWEGLVFEIVGPPAPVFQPWVGQHHTEVWMREVMG